MKKLISILTITLAGAFAFAITDARIAAMNKIAEASPIEINDAAVETAKPFIELVKSDLAAYFELEKASANNAGRWHYVIGQSATKLGEAPFAEDADTVITGGSILHHWANELFGNYEELKAREFKSVGGYKMAEYRILMLTLKTHSDPEAALKFVSENELAKNFKELLVATRKAKLSAEKNYKILSQIEQVFKQYRDTVDAVKNNWEMLQNDKNEAFMGYYAEAKLNSLTK